MSDVFRDLLKKVGSGPHTSKNLSQWEAQNALSLVLKAEATPAQIGAFFIAHRIKRPTGEELAGFLDALESLGPQIDAIESDQPVLVFSNPYDGRSRTAPISVITQLILATAGVHVLMHGSDQMPTKYGIPLIEVWKQLGVNWQGHTLNTLTSILKQQRVGFIYMGDHFAQFQALTPYRDQLGKRPPLATAELLWCPYRGESHLVSGYVHPPTERMLQEAFHCRHRQQYTTVKGLEGSSDLPRDRTAIVGIQRTQSQEMERLLLHARDFNLGGPEIPYQSPVILQEQMQTLLEGAPSDLYPAVVWNGGFYLWHQGKSESIQAGIEITQSWLESGRILQTLNHLRQALTTR